MDLLRRGRRSRILAAAVGIVEAFRVNSKGFQAELGTKINNASVIFSLIIIFGIGGHNPVTDQGATLCVVGGIGLRGVWHGYSSQLVDR